MTALRKKSRPRPASAMQRALHRGVVGERGKRAHERRTNEFGLFGLQRREQRVVKRRFRMALEPAIGDLADTIVAVASRPRMRRRCRGR